MNLNDLTIIVTGGARGLGRFYSIGLARAGANVVVADIADPTEVVAEVTEMGGTIEAMHVDITDEQSLDQMVAATEQRFGSIDVLVNNAAYFRDAGSGAFETIDIAELDRCLEVNVRGTWMCTRAVLPAMKRTGRGKIINVSSASVWKGQSATGPHYLTSKAAIIGLTRALARELGQYDICVNSLVPDAIPETVGDDRSAGASRQIDSRCIKRQQIPEDMVGTLVYLCGSGADFVTGQSLHVNGGSYLT